jgi:hypothetical protein
MQLNSYVKTDTNKWLLISESHDDLNRCTSCRGKPDQHVICFLHSVRIRHSYHMYLVQSTYDNLLRRRQLSWIDPLLPRKGAPDITHSTMADGPVGPTMVSLPSQPMKQME